MLQILISKVIYLLHILDQGFAIGGPRARSGPRATSGPRKLFFWPAQVSEIEKITMTVI